MRQYHGCGIYQPSGQLALVETSPPSSQALGVEQTGFLVATRDSRPRHSERRRISAVKGKPNLRDWRLHPQIVEMLWMRFGRASVDLFASRGNCHCPMFFSLRDVDAPLGVDALAHPWPRVLLYAFPPLCLIFPHWPG